MAKTYWMVRVHMAEDKKSAQVEYLRDTKETDPTVVDALLKKEFPNECPQDNKEGFMGLTSAPYKEYNMWDPACGGYIAYTEDGYACKAYKDENKVSDVVFWPLDSKGELDDALITFVPCEVR